MKPSAISEKIQQYGKFKSAVVTYTQKVADLRKWFISNYAKYGKKINEKKFRIAALNMFMDIVLSETTIVDAKKAEKLLKKKKLWLKVTDRFIDPKKVEQAWLDGDLTDDEVKSITRKKTVPVLKKYGEIDGETDSKT